MTIELNEERREALRRAKTALVVKAASLSHKAATNFCVEQRIALRKQALNAWHDARCMALMAGETI